MPRLLIASLGLACAFALAPPAMAQFGIGPGLLGPGGSGPVNATNLNSSRSNIYRQGNQGGGGGSAAPATTVK